MAGSQEKGVGRGSQAPPKSPAPAGHPAAPTLRVGAILIVEKRLLLVQQARGGEEGYWLLPGGGVRFGERLTDALRRELVEELGEDVGGRIHIGRPLALVESISPDQNAYPKHVVHVAMEASSGGIGPDDIASAPADPAVLAVRFFTRPEIDGLDIRPPIADFLAECFVGTSHDIRYLGRRW